MLLLPVISILCCSHFTFLLLYYLNYTALILRYRTIMFKLHLNRSFALRFIFSHFVVSVLVHCTMTIKLNLNLNLEINHYHCKVYRLVL